MGQTSIVNERITKTYITDRKWAGFCPAEDETNVVDPSIKEAWCDMYGPFDRIGEGLMCKIEVDDSGDMVLSFSKRSMEYFDEYGIDAEKWLDGANEYILGDDEFYATSDGVGSVCLVDTDGRITSDAA